MPTDLTTTFVDDDDKDDAGVDAAGPSTTSPSLCSMLERVLETQSSQHIILETFMTAQVAHGQLFDDLISNVAALRVDFTEYRSSFPPPPPLDV